jgi:TetR/AcrR family transcriptional regulator, repressor for neighboring sulfatase
MTTRGATRERKAGRPPVGRDEIVAAVLAHAADLFAERGPAATSIRDVAARSGVNQGLIFRHIGTKAQLVGAVLDQLAQHTSTRLESGASAAAIEAEGERHWKVLARAILDGFPVGELQRRFPGASMLVEHAQEAHADEHAARVAAANALALQLGWRLFGPFLRSATGLGDVAEDELRKDVDACAAGILGGD